MNQKTSMLILVLSATLSSCAINIVPEATGGSRSDGIVEFSYEYGALRRPEVDWAAADGQAVQRCAAWGYSSASAFSAPARECAMTDAAGSCLRFKVTRRYQCSD